MSTRRNSIVAAARACARNLEAEGIADHRVVELIHTLATELESARDSVEDQRRRHDYDRALLAKEIRTLKKAAQLDGVSS